MNLNSNSNLEISENSSIKDTLELINKNGSGAALIVDNNKELVGIVTDGDIRRALLKDIPLTTSIKVIMNPNPIVIKAKKIPSINKIYNMMLNKHIMILPVVDEKGKVKDVIKFLQVCKLKDRINKNNNKKNKKYILVIGGAGYIGSVLVKKLLSSGYRVIVVDNLLYGINPLNNLLKTNSSNLKFIKADIRNTSLLFRIMEKEDIDSIIHLAAIVGDEACRLSADFTIEVNYTATKRLAQLAKFFKIKKFIFASTCSVYGRGEGEFYEDSPTYPLSLYAKTKLSSEEALLSLADSDFLPIILRLSTVYGVSPRPRFDLVINLLTAKALTEKKITIYGGKQWRPFIHIKDTSSAFIKFLKEKDFNKNLIFNIGENNYQLSTIGTLIKKVVKEKANIDVEVVIEDKAYDLRNYIVNFDRLKSINFSCENNIQNGILEIINALKENPNWYDKRYSNYKELNDEDRAVGYG